MTPRPLGAPPGVLLPAELAARITLVLAVALVGFELAVGALWTFPLRAIYVGLCAATALVTFLPGLGPRPHGALVVGSWLAAGGLSLLVAGLREGFLILSTSVTLAGALFGLRAALAVVAVSSAWAAAMGWLHASGLPGSPERYTATPYAEAWLLYIVVFVGLAVMTSAVQARQAAAVRASDGRARAFATVAERSRAAVVFTGLDLRIVWVNEAFTELTGYTPAEAEGQRPGALLQGEGTSPDDVALMRAALAERRTVRVEIVNYRRDGEPYWVQVVVQPYYDEDGTLVGFTGSQLDVTGARTTATLDAVERALLGDFAAADAPSLDRALAQNLISVELVRYARVWRPGPEGLQASAVAEQRGRLGPATPPTSLAAHSPLVDGAVAVEPDPVAPTRALRVWASLRGGGQGVLELGVWRSMPGLATLSSRLPALLTLHGLFAARRADELHLEDLFTRSPEALLVLDPAGRVLRQNEAAGRLLPRLEGGCSVVERYPELAGALEGGRVEVGDSPQRLAPTWRVQAPSGEPMELEVRVGRAPGPYQSEVRLAVRDLTERVRQLDAARQALREREVLLKEVHHRVKNNLQIISSLLHMQVTSTSDPASASPLRESMLRVRSIALVHEALYGHESLARLDFGAYVRELVAVVRASLAPSARVEVEADAAEVGMDRAVSLGLALNELLTNAFKYGLPPGATPGASPEVRVRWRVEGALGRLSVADAGPGLEGAQASPRGLGLRLVRALAGQLRGRFEHRRSAEQGSVFELSCPLDAPEPQPADAPLPGTSGG